MTASSGSLSGSVSVLTMIAIPDEPLHSLMGGTVVGEHKSDDPLWNGAKMAYSGTGDFRGGGNGRETGYFRNEHSNGDITYGTYTADVTSSDMAMKAVGTWTIVSGTGRFAGVKGGGTFEAETSKLMAVTMKWRGDYELR